MSASLCFTCLQASALFVCKPLRYLSASLCVTCLQASALLVCKPLLYLSASLCFTCLQASALLVCKPGSLCVALLFCKHVCASMSLVACVCRMPQALRPPIRQGLGRRRCPMSLAHVSKAVSSLAHDSCLAHVSCLSRMSRRASRGPRMSHVSRACL